MATDLEHFLAYKNAYQRKLISSLLCHAHTNQLKDLVVHIIGGNPLPKYYYHAYYVICLVNLSNITL